MQVDLNKTQLERSGRAGLSISKENFAIGATASQKTLRKVKNSKVASKRQSLEKAR